MGRKHAVSKKGKRPQPRRRRWFLPGIVSVSLLLGVTAWLLWPERSPLADAPTYQGGPRLVVDRQEIDFGQVSFNKFVQARFRLKNVGDRTLQIATRPRVEAVEGCWPSDVVVGSTTLQPGQETDVSTEFTMHPGMGGPHLFVIPLQTNDPVEPKRELRIRSIWHG